jgi:hypothetical protein
MYQSIKTSEDIKALGFTNPYRIQEAENLLNRAVEVGKFHACEMTYDKDHDSFDLWLDKENQILINKHYNGQWSIYQRRHYDNVDSYKMTEIEKGIEKPKNFKVLSAKNINNWIDWYKKVLTIADKIEAENGNTKANFLARVEALKDRFKVIESNDKMSGWIESRNMTLRYEISKNGYVSQTIRVHDQSLDAFLDMNK